MNTAELVEAQGSWPCRDHTLPKASEGRDQAFCRKQFTARARRPLSALRSLWSPDGPAWEGLPEGPRGTPRLCGPLGSASTLLPHSPSDPRSGDGAGCEEGILHGVVSLMSLCVT